MADLSDNTMAPLMPLSPTSALIKRDSDDLLPKLEAQGGTTNATARPNWPSQMPQDSELQTKANDNTQGDSNGLESRLSPMTTAITLQIFVIVLVAIGGASLLWWQRKRRSARRGRAHGSRSKSDGNLWSKISRRAGLSKPQASISTSIPDHKLDFDEQPPVQQVPEPVLIRDSPKASEWLPELPSHQDINLHNSVTTGPTPPSSSASVAQNNLTLQRLQQDLAGAEGQLPLPPRALFTRQSTLSSNYAESIMSSAPSSRPSTIVYPSPLRPRPVTRKAPQ